MAVKVAEGIRQEQEAMERQRDRLIDRKEDLEIREAGLDKVDAIQAAQSGTPRYPNIGSYETKEKSPETANF